MNGERGSGEAGAVAPAQRGAQVKKSDQAMAGVAQTSHLNQAGSSHGTIGLDTDLSRLNRTLDLFDRLVAVVPLEEDQKERIGEIILNLIGSIEEEVEALEASGAQEDSSAELTTRLMDKMTLLDRLTHHAPLTDEQREELVAAVDGLIDAIEEAVERLRG